MKLLLALLLAQAVPLARPPVMHAAVINQGPPVQVLVDGPARSVLITHCPNGYRVTVFRANGTHFTHDFTGQKIDVFAEMK
jgi:hypothetical protein